MTWPTIRVFVSSTFRDMQAERDHLIRLVFPELRERCRQRQLELIDVDLRWGVTAHETEQKMALDICLDEIDTCRPYFVGLLGQRYGWVPPGQERSITAQEIYHGVLESGLPTRVRTVEILREHVTDDQFYLLHQSYQWRPDLGTYVLQSHLPAETLAGIRKAFSQIPVYQRNKSFFYFRKPIKGLPRDPFYEVDPKARQRLGGLKDEIAAAGLPLYQYQGRWDPLAGRIVELEELGRRVLEDIWRLIDAEYPAGRIAPMKDWLEEEAGFHELFMADRTRRFVGRGDLLAAMSHFVDGPGSERTLVLVGEPGSGKSALMSRFTRDLEATHPDWLVVSHFVGASPASANLQSALRRLCMMFARAVGDEELVPQDQNGIEKAFAELLEKAGAVRRVVLVIDAVNQFEHFGRTMDMRWLPERLPPGVSVILSTLSGRALTSLRERHAKPVELVLTGLTLADRREIARTFLVEYRKKFPTEAIEQAFIGNPATANALYLVVALEELRVFGHYEQIGERIHLLPADVSGLFESVLARLESMAEFGSELVRAFMVNLASGRQGLTAIEIQHLLRSFAPRGSAGEEADRLPDMTFARLRRAVAAYLFERSGVLDFFHQQLLEAVRHRYLIRIEDRRASHSAIADYFIGRWREPYVRAVGELPWQLIQAHRWGDLEDVLMSLEFLETKAKIGTIFALISDFDDAIAALPKDRPRYRLLCLLHEALGRDAAFISRHQSAIFQCLWNSCWWYDCSEAANHYETPVGGWPMEGPPWKRPGAKLFHILESWYLSKKQRHGFIWLRSLRPPVLPLGTMPQIVCRGHLKGVTCLAFDPRGRWIVSGGSDHVLKMWDSRSGETLASLDGHISTVNGVAVSPDGQQIASASRDGTVRVWDVHRTVESLVITPFAGNVSAVTFSRNGEVLVGACADSTLRAWDAVTGDEILCMLGHKSPADSLAVSPDWRWIVSAGGNDMTVRIWDAISGIEKRCISGFKRRVSCAAFSHDGKRITATCNDRTVGIWDAASGEEQIRFVGQDDGGLSCVAFSPDDATLVTGSNGWVNDHSIRVWNSRDGSLVQAFHGHEDDVNHVCFSPDGRSVLSGSADGTVRIWRLEGVTAPYRLRGYEPWGYIESLAFSSDGERLVSASMDLSVRVWRVNTGIEGLCLNLHEKGNRANLTAMFSPDGARVVLVVHDVVQVCDAATGAEEIYLRGHEGQVDCVVFSPDGKCIATGGNDMTVRVWDASTGAELMCLRGHEKHVNSIAYSPDGQHIVSTSFDGTIRVWNLTDGGVSTCLRGHVKPVECAVFSPDGRRIVSRAVDQTVRVWDAATSTQILCMNAHENGAQGLAFSSSGQWIISAATRPAATHIWNAETGATRAVLQGNCDVEAMAAGPMRFPWNAITNKLETIVESNATGDVVACFAGDLGRITTHTSGVIWAGADGANLRLIALEVERPPVS